MLTKSGANQPSPRHPRHQDDGVVILVTLGTIGGLAGWFVVSGFPFASHDATRSVVLPENFSTFAETTPPQISPATPAVPPNTANADTLGQDTVDSLPPADEPGELESSDRATVEPAIPPVPALPPMPSSDSAPLPPPPETAPAPPNAAPLIVPDPQIPTGDRADNLAVIRPALSFTDVPEGFWAKPYIDALTARGVISGLPQGRFEPNRPMTRAELAAQIAQAFALEPQRENKNFADLASDYWATAPIQEAVTTGFMTGYPDGDFRPNTTLTRLQVLVALATGLSLPATNRLEPLIGQYQDAAAVPEWAQEQVASMIAADILSPLAATDAALQPNAPATRAEVATLIYRALAYMGKVEPLE